MLPAHWPWRKKFCRQRSKLLSSYPEPTRLELEVLERRICFSNGTLLTAPSLTFHANHTAQAANFLAKPNEVDLYRVALGAGDRISAAVSAQASGSGLVSLLRVFNAEGTPLALDDQEGGDPHLTFQAASAGYYFIGVSSAPNDSYDPHIAGSGTGGGTTGLYTLNLQDTPGAALQADLTGSSFRLGSGTAAWGESISGTFTIQNRGGADSAGFTVQLVLSSGTGFNSADPSLILPATFASGPPTLLATGHAYTDQFSVQLPSAAPANFPALSGPVYVGLLITPNDRAQDSGIFDKSGVHRGADWEKLTILTPVPPDVNLLFDANPNFRIDGTLLTASQVNTCVFFVTAPGNLNASVVPVGTGTFVPRLILEGFGGQVLLQSDAGILKQHLEPGIYGLAVASLSGVGSYRLSTEFVQASAPFAPVKGGKSPPSAALADVNGDGRPDLVTANRYKDTVSVLLGNGDGTFQPEQTFNVGAYPSSVTAADVNGDGRLDLVVTNKYGNSVSVLLGNGDGTFQPQQTFNVGVKPLSAAVADVNGDGRPDLVVADSGTQFTPGHTVTVLLNSGGWGEGDGAFQDSPDYLAQHTFTVGAGPFAVAAADLNGDGQPDLVAANYDDNTISVLLGNGDGSFQKQRTFPVGLEPHSVAVADVNGDGRPDLVVANMGKSTVSVLLGNGHGEFLDHQTFPVRANPIFVAVADINGDGRLDLVTANVGNNTVNVLVGNGDGSFQTRQTFIVGLEPFAVVVADLNGDGHPDLVTANLGDSTESVLLGNGDDSFQTAQAFAVGLEPFSVAVADVNGDGRPDLITANFGDNTVSVLLGEGDGSFQTQQTFAVGSGPRSVVVADVNGDGRPDPITANANAHTVSVLLGNGDGSFQPAETFSVSASPHSVVVADLNGDGRPDLVTINSNATISVLLGKGDGTFKAAPTIDVAEVAESVAVADFNGDGRPDLVIAYLNDTIVSVLLGKGDGTFTSPQSFAVGAEPFSVAVADVNGDGRPDIVTANVTNSVSVLLGKGDGTFPTHQTFTVGYGPLSVAVADLDGDGRADVIITNSDDTISVLLGKGDGTFPTQRSFPAGSELFTVVVADVNGDGHPDLVASDRGDSAVSVLLGNGDGTFTAATTLTGVAIPDTPYLADLNGDGILDSVILDRSGNILFRAGLPGTDNQFHSPVTLNDTAMIGANRPARDLTVVKTKTGWAIATADASFDPTLSSAGPLVYTVSLYTIGTHGSVIRTTAFSTPFLPTRIAAADLTGDGLDDLVVANSLNNTIQVAFQQPGRTFAAPLTLNVGVTPSDIALVDVDQDGRKDIVVADQASGTVTVLLNDSIHPFSNVETFQAGVGLSEVIAATTGLTVNSLLQSVSLAVGNFTGTGQNDLVLVNRGTRGFTILPNDGSGFGDPQSALTTSTNDGVTINSQAGPVVTADFHGADGLDSHRAANADLAILMQNRGEVWIYTNNGDGTFTLGQQIPVGSLAAGLSVVPGSKAGLFDLLVGNQFGDILRLIGTGDGSFAPPPTLTGDNVPLDVVNLKSNITDVLVADQNTNTITVQTPTADKSGFTTLQTLADNPDSHLAPGAVQWAKLEGSAGLYDAIVIGSGSNSVMVYHTTAVDPVTGKPTFAAPTSFSVGTDPVAVTIQDINGDGIPDMLVANKGSNDISVLFGSIVNRVWTGTLGPRLSSEGSAPIATALTDLNGDQIPDLVVTNSSSGTLTVLPGRGQGFFDDRPANVQTFGIGSAIVQSLVDSSGQEFLVRGDGGISSFNGKSFTDVFDATSEKVGLLGDSDGTLVAVFTDGNLGILKADAGGFYRLSDEDAASLANARALEVLNGLNGLEVYVTRAGEDVPIILTGADFIAVVTDPTPGVIVGVGTTLAEADLTLVATAVVVPFNEIVVTPGSTEQFAVAFVGLEALGSLGPVVIPGYMSGIAEPGIQPVSSSNIQGESISPVDRYRIGLEESIQRLLQQRQSELQYGQENPPPPAPTAPVEIDPEEARNTLEGGAMAQTQLQAPAETVWDCAITDSPWQAEPATLRWEMLLGVAPFLVAWSGMVKSMVPSPRRWGEWRNSDDHLRKLRR